MAGRYGVWVVTAVVATAYLGVAGVAAAVASPLDAVQSSISQHESATIVDAAAAVEPLAVESEVVESATVESATVGGAAPDGADAEQPGPTSVPETPAADVPVAESSSPTYTPVIMVTGMVFLGVAILIVVRSGSTRHVEEPE